MIGPEDQLRRIQRLMGGLALVGALALWGVRSGASALAFALGCLASWAFWSLHVLMVKRMLTPGQTGRGGYVLLTLGKLTLIGIALAGIMERYPEEGIPFAMGLLLSVGAILLEAVILAFSKVETLPPEPPHGPND